MGVRTPIRFGAILSGVVQQNLRDWVEVEYEATDEHVLYLFHQAISGDWRGFILFQGARRAGRITAELAICRRTDYPLYHARMRPFMAVDGVRERLAMIYQMEDRWWEYRTQEMLESALREIINDVRVRGFDTLKDLYGPMLRKEMARGDEIMAAWRAQEAERGERPLGARYSDMPLEHHATEVVENFVDYGSPRLLGKLAGRFADPSFRACQVFATAWLMQTVAPESIAEVSVPVVKGDEGAMLAGRSAPHAYLTPPSGLDESLDRYAFFKALGILEACFDK